MMDGLVDKKIRAFWIFGENLANTEPEIRKVEHELSSAEFLISQDIFLNETTAYAHVILPAAAWSENDGTFTNSERRVSRVRTASTPPGVAKPNWWIFRELARRFGQTWPSNSPREIWDNEIAALAPNFKGITYNRIEHNGLQWPCPSADHPGTVFLHKAGQFTRGKGVFNPTRWTPPAEVADAEYPFVLSTGRRLYHYNARTQTGRCEGIDDLLGEETCDISPGDARRLGILQEEKVRVSSRRGSVEVKARVTPEIPDGMIWMSFHFREGNSNWLTNPAYDPETLTAEYKACAVQDEKI
jgi:formate dehydrogenase major subunit